MSINENAELDPSQVEDMRGAGGRGGGGFNFPPMGGGGGGGGGGMGGAGCLAGLLPVLMRSKIGMAVLLVGALCIGVLICTGGGSSLFSGVGGLTPGQPNGQPGPNDVNSSALAQQCDKSNPDRFDNPACRNLLYINSIQSYWRAAMPQYLGQQYQPATTRFFTGSVSTACGPATAGVGPFYCPGDNHVYIDLSFYDELANRFGAKGQFAQAYVLAHEYGHHIQTLLGTEAQVRRAQQRDPANANRYSVAMELQADCYAGVWANAAAKTTDATGQPLFKSVTQQDIDQALEAAAAVGDDAIQQKAGGRVNQEAFTHGSSEQRQQWFNQGYRTGDPRQCDTFGS
ncbi:neutral zinc metallopeptidase [Catellatospora sp. NPDC049609]|uniref:KPN_02809 family neutral zinc metallopeptidase n=1 Tax=Catellatospora sp. NPDC049609 TaxID=3155505 RepID=UPI00344A4F94